MSAAMNGSQGQPDKLFRTFSATPEFKSIQMDLKTTTGIDELEALPNLVKNLNGGDLPFPAVPGESMEDDDLCQISTLLLMLDSTVKHVAALLKKPVKQI